MKTLFSRQFVGVLALLCSSVSTAATVTMTSDNLNPSVGESFTITVSATDFSNIGGGTLDWSWDTGVATIQHLLTNVSCAACLPVAGPMSSLGTIIQLRPDTWDALPVVALSGDFEIARFTFTALASGALNFVLNDDGGTFTGWFDNTTAEPVATSYVQATVVVAGGAAEPNIVVTDSIPAADDLTLAFSPTQVGGPNPSGTVTVTNSGTAALLVGNIGAPAETAFDVTADTCSNQSLAPTESCTVTVQFAPTLAQAYVGTLAIPSDDPDTASATVNLTGTGTAAPVAEITVTDSVAPTTDLSVGFGNVTIATTANQTITVKNDGGAALSISAVNISDASFTKPVDGCVGQTLAPTVSCNITVQFAPGAAQAYAGTVDILSDDSDEPTVTVALAGTGTPPVPVATVTDTVVPANDNLIPFGNVTIGGTSPVQTVTVANSGTVGLVIGTIAGANALAAPFFIANDLCSGNTVTPATSCTFEVTFQPTALGADNDGFDIPSNAAGSPITFNVNGTGVPVPVPDITVTDSVGSATDLTVTFGTVALSDTATQTVTVTNDGSEDLVITDVTAPALPFEISSNLCNAQTLAPTDTCTITVAFTPTDAVVSNASLGIASDDPDEASVIVALSGTGSDGSIVIDGGSSAVDPWSLALLGGLPFLRRRRKAVAMKLAVAAAAGVLAAPAAMAADAEWDWDYDGLYLGAGVIGTSIETSDEFSSFVQSKSGQAGTPISGRFEDFPYGGQLYAGWMFNNIFGIEGRLSNSEDGESDILFARPDGSRDDIGDIEIALDGWTVYGVANWPIAQRFDLFAKAGYTDQNADLDITANSVSPPIVIDVHVDDDDGGFAGALGARWRFARHWAATVEGEYLGVDFEVDDGDGGRVDAVDEPWRVGLNVEYWFGGHEIAPPPPPPPARVAAAPPPPPPPAPKDSDGDGVVDPSDQCADTPKGDRVGPAGCSCDVSRQLTFKTDSAELSDADKLVLDEMAENLTRLKFISGVIEGHTDSTGADAYNQGLSERRAQAAADYLASKGISGDRLEIVGRGESDPVGDNATAEGRAQNRRVVAKRTDCDK